MDRFLGGSKECDEFLVGCEIEEKVYFPSKNETEEEDRVDDAEGVKGSKFEKLGPI